MLIKLLGVVWIAAAVFLFLKPQAMKLWLKQKRGEKFLIILPLLIGSILIYAGVRNQGIAANLVVIFGCMGVIKTILFLNENIYNKMVDWSLELPDLYYKVGACFHACIGLLLVTL